MKYRKELDGIRAVAVVPMVLFHAGIEQFNGGYIGVDMFFVVSGFLITSIFLAEKAENRFSMVRFYERRARRILPALFLVVSVTMLLAWLWMTPSQLTSLSGSALSVVLYVSNFFFWQQGNYFGVASEQMPLLHTWSLGVEEQFYVIFPVFMVLIWRLGARNSVSVIAIIAVLSFALAEWGTRAFPSAAYYLTPTRAWELLAGVLAAYYLLDSQGQPRSECELRSGLGLALLLGAIFTYDDSTPFPGVYALVPVAGTLLIILYAGSGTIVGRLLSTRLMVWVGVLSYSIYLWHQPLFAYARILGVSSEEHWFFLLLGLVAVGLAYLTWLFVEEPFRNRNRFSRASIFKFSSIAAVVTGSCAAIAVTTDVGQFRWTPDQLKVLDYTSYPREDYYREKRCFLLPGQGFGDFSDECKGSDSALTIWGDSHAASLYMGLFAVGDSGVGSQLTVAACPPILGYVSPANRSCKNLNQDIFAFLASGGTESVILLADWRYHSSVSGWLDNLHATVEQLVKGGVRVYLIGSLPQWRPSLPVLVAKDMRAQNLGLSNLSSQYRLRDWRQLHELDADLLALAQETGAVFLPLMVDLCRQDLCDALIPGGEGVALMAWDHSHLTMEGSLYVGERLMSRLNGIR